MLKIKTESFFRNQYLAPKTDEVLCLRIVAKQAPGGHKDQTGPGTKTDDGQRDSSAAKNHGAQNCSIGIAAIQVPGTINDTSSTKTPANKRRPPDLSSLADTAVIEQLRILQHDKLELMDYVESLLISLRVKLSNVFHYHLLTVLNIEYTNKENEQGNVLFCWVYTSLYLLAPSTQT